MFSPVLVSVAMTRGRSKLHPVIGSATLPNAPATSQ
jgi:hypothetical protein